MLERNMNIADFDPELATKFLEILPKIIEIRVAHADEEDKEYDIYDLAAAN